MKISLAWLFDHIDSNWKNVNISDLVNKFNKTTAEIEGWQHIETDLNNFSFGKVQKTNEQETIVEIVEWNVTTSLAARKNINIGDWLLIIKQNNAYCWATMNDLGSSKDGILPALYLENKLYAGEWKKYFETSDYILEVDNKSITHRPDMWGHRGFAREVAAILGVPLKPLNTFLHPHQIQKSKNTSYADGLEITITDTSSCKRFAGLHIPTIENKASLLWMTTRLARVDSKSINTIVDCTNYVMLDLSQPMHSFDAELLPEKTISIAKASDKDTLILLDGEKIELSNQDIVIYDGKKPMALAGVMGGQSSEIRKQTQSILLESASFDATTVRLTSARHKKRTEASARFEKSLDQNQNIDAISRFLKICNDAGIKYSSPSPIISLGQEVLPLSINVTHEFIERRLGTAIKPNFILNTLHALACEAVKTKDDNITSYTITIPTFRSSKDIQTKEDIVEEVGRFFGYDNIQANLPYLQLAPSNTYDTMRERTIKKSLAYAGKMREVYTYSFFDESFLRTINWYPCNTVTVKNPVSENWKSMVTSLIPHLFKTVEINAPEQDQLRFFEWARTWHQSDVIVEKKSLAGIMYDQKKAINFYDAKTVLQQLFDELRIAITWQRVDEPEQPWFAPHQTAHLIHKGQRIGIAGMANTAFLNTLCEGQAFIFEVDGDQLLNCEPKEMQFTPTSKYPEVVRDVSMLIPLSHTTKSVTELISLADTRIVTATLIDFFQKKEWGNQKSITMRLVLRDMEKTMTKDEVDQIYVIVTKKLQSIGATIR